MAEAVASIVWLLIITSSPLFSFKLDHASSNASVAFATPIEKFELTNDERFFSKFLNSVCIIKPPLLATSSIVFNISSFSSK